MFLISPTGPSVCYENMHDLWRIAVIFKIREVYLIEINFELSSPLQFLWFADSQSARNFKHFQLQTERDACLSSGRSWVASKLPKIKWSEFFALWHLSKFLLQPLECPFWTFFPFRSLLQSSPVCVSLKSIKMLQIKLKVSTSVWQLASLSDHHHQPFTDLPLHLHALHFQLTIANPSVHVALQKLLFNFFANSLNLCSTQRRKRQWSPSSIVY